MALFRVAADHTCAEEPSVYPVRVNPYPHGYSPLSTWLSLKPMVGRAGTAILQAKTRLFELKPHPYFFVAV